jgi:hypothetical protein
MHVYVNYLLIDRAPYRKTTHPANRLFPESYGARMFEKAWIFSFLGPAVDFFSDVIKRYHRPNWTPQQHSARDSRTSLQRSEGQGEEYYSTIFQPG